LKGFFTISLDFELHWGGFEKWPIQITNDELRMTNGVPVQITNEELRISNGTGSSYNQYFLNTRRIIPQMLDMFEEYGAHVTWATVGMLFHQSREELTENLPSEKPSYREGRLSAYNYISDKGIGSNEVDDPFHFASSLIEEIARTPFQELGTHTFAHYYCNEEGQTVEQFREDIRAAQRAARKFGKVLRSLVFPRNQFNDQYLRVCFEEGITAVRSNPLDWFWHIESTQSESAWKRLNRGLDAYLPIGKKNTYKLDAVAVRDNIPVRLPASRLLRPYRPKELFLNSMKINRIKSEMSRAAEYGEVYHLWWHPHNFGWYPEESMEGLLEILKHYSFCRDKWGMGSMNMGELAESVLDRSTLDPVKVNPQLKF
jgi:peptidoglycan/xylan/chitin deacetylase (PgdA/CDA1 family)